MDRLQRLWLFRHSFVEPSEFYTHLINLTNTACKVTGLDVFTPGYTLRTVNFYYVVIMTTFYLYIDCATAWEMRHEPENFINCLVTIGIAFQLIAKLATFARYYNELVWMYDYTKNLYSSEFLPHRKIMLMKKVFLLSVIVKTMVVCYGFTSISLVVAPVWFMWKTGQKILPFGFHIPYMDQTSWGGYGVNYLVQLMLTVNVTSVDIGPDCIYVIIMMSSFTQIDLIINSLKEMNHTVQQEAEGAVNNDFEEIIKRHQEHLKYLSTAEKVFRANFLVTFVSLSSVLVTALYAAVMLSWYQGYVFAIFLSYQLFFGCILGTLLEIKIEQLQREIYNLPWYKLSAANKKSLQFALLSAQQSGCPTLIFSKLNMPTYLQVTKTIYSIFTMLLTVSDDE